LNEQNDVPVYLFTGFLESGKTKFIQETLEDKRFNNGERTLLLVCEEGEEEYAPDQFSGKNVFIREVENEAELTAENLDAWLKEPTPPAWWWNTTACGCWMCCIPPCPRAGRCIRNSCSPTRAPS
jgi:hypothetical protein